MRAHFLTLALTGVALALAGCATGFHAGGPRAGVGVGAAVGPAAPTIVAPPEATPYLPPTPR